MAGRGRRCRGAGGAVSARPLKRARLGRPSCLDHVIAAEADFLEGVVRDDEVPVAEAEVEVLHFLLAFFHSALYSSSLRLFSVSIASGARRGCARIRGSDFAGSGCGLCRLRLTSFAGFVGFAVGGFARSLKRARRFGVASFASSSSFLFFFDGRRWSSSALASAFVWACRPSSAGSLSGSGGSASSQRLLHRVFVEAGHGEQVALHVFVVRFGLVGGGGVGRMLGFLCRWYRAAGRRSAARIRRRLSS